MKKIKALLIILVLLSAFSLTAKEAGKFYVGVSGDYVYNMMVTPTGYRDNVTYKPGHGFSLSIPAVYQLNDWFGIETGVTYREKNYTWEMKTNQMELSRATEWIQYRNSYLEFPITANFTIGEGMIKSVTSVGAYFGVWLHSGQKGEISQSGSHLVNMTTGNAQLVPFEGSTGFNKTRDNRFEAGLLARTGVEVDIAPAVVFFRTSFSLGLTDMNNHYQKNIESKYNNSITAEAGILIGFGG